MRIKIASSGCECPMKIAKRRVRLFRFDDPRQRKRWRRKFRQLNRSVSRVSYSLDALLAQCGDGPPVERAWENMPLVGREVI